MTDIPRAREAMHMARSYIDEALTYLPEDDTPPPPPPPPPPSSLREQFFPGAREGVVREWLDVPGAGQTLLFTPWLMNRPERFTRDDGGGLISPASSTRGIIALPPARQGSGRILWTASYNAAYLNSSMHGQHGYNLANTELSFGRRDDPRTQLRLDFNRLGTAPRVTIHMRSPDGENLWDGVEPSISLGPALTPLIDYAFEVTWDMPDVETLDLMFRVGDRVVEATIPLPEPHDGPGGFFGHGHIEDEPGTEKVWIQDMRVEPL